MKILVLNAGSSSLKSGCYDVDDDQLPDRPATPIWQAQIDWTDQQDVAELEIETAKGSVKQEIQLESLATSMVKMLETLWTGETQVITQPQDIDIVGHRIVHGGQDFRASTIVTPAVKAAIDRFAPLAPSHNPAELKGIEAIEQVLAVPQVAVFDTAFHQTMPEAAAIYPIPYAWVEQGIRRYGFHGTSHRYCAQRAAELLQRDLKALRLINCHLGNGCSLAAIRDGQSIDTTMGFTPLDGLMMGTRSGAIDPSILTYLIRQEGMTADQLDQMLNKDSGLKGLSGLSGDMRQIDAAIAQGHAQAQLAFDVYIHRLRSCIGSMLPHLNGLDALIFTAGVGENSAAVRASACAAFEFLGIQLDPEKNQTRSPDDRDIATADSRVRVLVIHTEEDWAIAQDCWQLYRQRKS
jgi:acetate kinase